MSTLSSLAEPVATPEVLTPKTLGGLNVVSVHEAFEYINMLVYGDPGVGKTTLAATADEIEELRPVLVVDVEGGTMSIRDKYPRVDAVRVKSWTDMQKVYDAIRKGEGGYRTVVLDSLTEMQKFSMLEIMKQVLADHPDRDPEVASVREWGKSTEQIRRLVRAFRDLPVNAIFTAFGAEETTDKGVVTKVKPSLPGKLSAEVSGFVDIVSYMYIKQVDGEPQRLLLSRPNGKHVVKDRSDKLPPVVVEPTMPMLYNLMFNTQKAA